MLAISVAVLMFFAPLSGSDATVREVQVPVVPVEAAVPVLPGPVAAEATMQPCEGVAPTYPGCLRGFTISGPFGFRQTFGFEYSGYFYMRWWTSTGFGQTWCTKRAGQAPMCVDSWGGFFAVGQRLDILVVTPAFGYWKVASA